jgi:hypothetical protein
MKLDIVVTRDYVGPGPRHRFVLALKREEEKWLLPLRILSN